MHLYRRKDSRWWWVRATIAPARGSARASQRAVVIRQSTGTSDRVEAHRIALQIVDDARQRMAGSNGVQRITLREAAERVRKQAKMDGLADFGMVSSRIDKMLGLGRWSSGSSGSNVTKRYHFDPDMWLDELTTEDVEAYKRARIEEGLKPATVNNELWLIPRMVRLARGCRKPEDLEVVKLKVRQRTRYLMRGEEARLLAELDPLRASPGLPPPDRRSEAQQGRLQDQYDLVVLLLDTGMRYGEAVRLPWLAIDTQGWHWIEVARTKTGNASRLGQTARLRELLQRRWADSNYGQRWDWVFPGWSVRTGTRVNRPRAHATGGITKAIERAGLNAPHLVQRYGRFTVHSLRHSFASNLLQSGRVSLSEIQELLGHSNMATTERYAHLRQGAAAASAVDVLDRIGSR